MAELWKIGHCSSSSSEGSASVLPSLGNEILLQLSQDESKLEAYDLRETGP